jgi:alkanesulfonate monooxygenase SsuD/methylene tetrahydromethanopterin reductase-like flavin-dependent oxidoreductase (luciferase family)
VVLQSARRPPVEECWTVARLCDDAGMDLWVGDSVVAKPRLEPLTTLAYLAAITKRARLGTAILLPALRQPTVLAHALANIDQLSQGRLVLGLGVGWGLPEIAREWEACGRDHKRRAKDLEEHIVVWRKLWTGDPVTYEGRGFRLSGHTIGPVAVERGRTAGPDHRGKPGRDDTRADRPRRAARRRRRHHLSHRR